MNCQKSEYRKEGIVTSLVCKETGSYCLYQRYCPQQHIIVNKSNYMDCEILKREENNIMAKNNTKVQSSPKVEESNKKKSEAVVILITPQYIIANKNGNAIRIKSSFNYKKGDIIEI